MMMMMMSTFMKSSEGGTGGHNNQLPMNNLFPSPANVPIFATAAEPGPEESDDTDSSSSSTISSIDTSRFKSDRE